MALRAPYRSIPISAFIHEPDWKDDVSIDHPHPDGLTGWLGVTLTGKTELMIGGERRPQNDGPTAVDFFKVPEGQNGRYAIPGASLRGMLRAVLEIAAFGRGAFVDDVRPGVRDLSGPSEPIYRARLDLDRLRAGWLLPRDPRTQELRLQPCDWARAHITETANVLTLDANLWNDAQHVEERYAKAGAGLDDAVMYVKPASGEPGEATATARPGASRKTGSIVFTTKPVYGTPSQRNKKKREFFFHDFPAGDPRGSPFALGRQWTDFLLINTWDEDRDRIQEPRRPGWKYWKERHAADKRVPVFYIVDDSGELDALGTAMMFRITHEKSVADLLDNASTPRTDSRHRDGTVRDIPTLLFGPQLDGVGEARAFKGRVSVETFLADPARARLADSHDVLLASPSAAFFPAMVEQARAPGDRVAGGLYASYTPQPTSPQPLTRRPELAGRKRYPAKPELYLYQGPEQSRRMRTRMRPLRSGAQFEGRIRFHNLLPVELGALAFAIELWAGSWGERPDLRHRLGMGKPLGLGDVRLDITDARIEPNRLGNDKVRRCSEGSLTVAEARGFADAFAAHMDTVFSTAITGAGGTLATWRQSEQIELLLAMSDPDFASAAGDLQYMTLEDHQTKRQAGAILPASIRRSATLSGEGAGSVGEWQAFPRPKEPQQQHPAASSAGRGGGQPNPPREPKHSSSAGQRKRDPNGDIALVRPGATRPGYLLLRYDDGDEVEWPAGQLTDP